MLLSNNFLPNQSTVKSNQTRAPFQHTFIVINIFIRIPFHVCLYMLVFGCLDVHVHHDPIMNSQQYIFLSFLICFLRIYLQSQMVIWYQTKNSVPKSKIHSFIILMTIAASTQEFYARYHVPYLHSSKSLKAFSFSYIGIL